MRVIGRYEVHDEIAAGGMATVHLGRLLGRVGFSRPVAIKRMHPQFAKDAAFVGMFVDEARIAGRISHPNVVPMLDVCAEAGELMLVMELVIGESLSRLASLEAKRGGQVPVPIAIAIAIGALQGLHAAHEAKDERGESLGIVHRDVSPQNILVGGDGVARVLDFGVAKAAGRFQETEDGVVKGKLAYMPPEQILGEPLDRRGDVYAAAVVLWEVLAGRRLFKGENPGAVMHQVLSGDAIVPIRTHRPEVSEAVDAVVLRALSTAPEGRFATARDMALALEAEVAPATSARIAAWVEDLAGARLKARAEQITAMETATSSDPRSIPDDIGAILDGPPDASAPATREPHESHSAKSEVRPLALSTPAVDAAPPPPHRRLAPYVIGAVVAATAGFFLFRHGAAPAATSATPEPVASAPSTPLVALAAVASVPAVAVSSPVAAPPAVDVRPAAPAVDPPAATSKGKKAPAVKATKVDCSTPFIVDASGTRIPKRECF